MGNNNNNKQRIKYRIRKKVNGSGEKPRLSVYRSNKNIYCQLIDDLEGKTLASASSAEFNGAGIEQATQVGKAIADKASSMNIDSVVFDRGGYLYHGRVKALADSAREAGLKF